MALAGLCLVAMPAGEGARAQTAPAASPSAPASKYQNKKQDFNENTVTIVSGQTSGAFLKLAEDLQNVLDRRENNEMRILPIVGTPGPQNILDVMFLRGVDMCMTETDYFDYFKKLDRSLYGNIDQRIHYIAKLFNTEFHIVARKEIQSISDLRGKKVSVYNKLSSADVSGRNMFELLGVNVEIVNYDQPVATDKLKKGEIDAMIRLAGAPINAFADIKPEDGMHFVPIGPDNVPGGFQSPLMQTYLPARLRSEDYPNLIPPGESVSTIASSVVLATYAWPEGTDRYRRVAAFVNAFFNDFDKFKDKTRHPKWQQTNLAAEVQGWTRFKAAQQWLDGKRGDAITGGAAAPAKDPTTASFERFLAHVKTQSGAKPLNEGQIQSLRQEFNKWRSSEGADIGQSKANH
jgi:TRAP transporter TAXI family solute receptor